MTVPDHWRSARHEGPAGCDTHARDVPSARTSIRLLPDLSTGCGWTGVAGRSSSGSSPTPPRVGVARRPAAATTTSGTRSAGTRSPRRRRRRSVPAGPVRVRRRIDGPGAGSPRRSGGLRTRPAGRRGARRIVATNGPSQVGRPVALSDQAAFAYVDSRAGDACPSTFALHRHAAPALRPGPLEDNSGPKTPGCVCSTPAKRYRIVPIGFIASKSTSPNGRQSQPSSRRVACTMLMTDIEGCSTGLVHRLGASFGGLIDDVWSELRTAVAGCGGHEVEARADEFFAVFETGPRSAVDAWIAIQRVSATRRSSTTTVGSASDPRRLPHLDDRKLLLAVDVNATTRVRRYSSATAVAVLVRRRTPGTRYGPPTMPARALRGTRAAATAGPARAGATVPGRAAKGLSTAVPPAAGLSPPTDRAPRRASVRAVERGVSSMSAEREPTR